MGRHARGVQHKDVNDDAVGAELVPERVDGGRVGNVAGEADDLAPERRPGFSGELLRGGGHDVGTAAEDDDACGRGRDEALRYPVPDARAPARDHHRLAGLGELGALGAYGGVGGLVEWACEGVFVEHGGRLIILYGLIFNYFQN